MTKNHPRCKFTPRVYICTWVYIVHINEAYESLKSNTLNNQKLNNFSSQDRSDLDLLCPNVLYLLLRSLLLFVVVVSLSFYVNKSNYSSSNCL